MATLRSFGTELSANRRPNGEYTAEARAAIVFAYLTGTSLAELVDMFKADNESTIRSIVAKATATNTTQTAPRRLGKYRTTFHAERRLVFFGRKVPRILLHRPCRRRRLRRLREDCEADSPPLRTK